MLSGMLAACGDNGQPQSIEDSPSGSNSVAVLDDLSSYVELTRGSINTDKYGNKFGDIPNQDSATFTFAGCEGETNLSVTGYDIDTNAEIEVVVNDVRIGHLSQSARNNAVNSGDQFDLDALLDTFGASLRSVNNLSFNQTKRNGERWGVTNILVSECNPDDTDSGTAAGGTDYIQLTGTPDVNQYGYKFGDSTYYSEAVFSFKHRNAELTLSVTGYDIDKSDEVSVWLNDNKIGTLSRGRNRKLNSGDQFTLPVNDQRDGQNLIRFRQNKPGADWGVTNLSLAAPSDTRPTTPLEIQISEFAVIPTEANARLISLTNNGVNLYAVSSIEGKIYSVSKGEASLWLDVKQALAGKLNTTNSTEGGVRSLAFHPEYINNRKFYTSEVHDRPSNAAGLNYLSDALQPSGLDSVVSEWIHNVDGTFTGPREVVRIGNPGQHIIKQISFNPHAEPGDEDYGLLYIAHGDGGHYTTPLGGHNNDALGKILRINPLQKGSAVYTVPASNPFVSDSDMLDEVYALGLRNPHNLSFTKSGQLIVADIGNRNVDEVNFVDAGGDYGWKLREGNKVYLSPDRGTGVAPLPDDDATFGYTYPVAQLEHDPDYDGGIAIAGGYPIENGSELDNIYIYGEFATIGDLYYSYLDEMAQAETTGDPSLLRTAPTLDFNVFFDHDDNPATASLKKDSMLDIINDSPRYSPASNRADIRFGRGPLGEVYITSKQIGTIYLIENSVPPLEAVH